MSHDRGCACGRERSEYDSCVEPNCFKKDNRMEDTDWRPSPCPSCGELRAAAKYPVCCNRDCKYYAYRGDLAKIEETRTMKTEKQYLWVKTDRAPMFVTDLVALYKDRDFDPSEDKIYEIGPEVKLELNVKVTPAKPVYRENASGYRVPFENRD
jgi:hypothetical protein